MDASRLKLTREDLACMAIGMLAGTALAALVYCAGELLWWLLAPALGFAA